MAVTQQRAGRGERARVSPLVRLRRFAREVRAELRKVVWPSRKELSTYTAVVIVMVLLAAFVLGLVDLAVSEVLAVVLRLRG